jgi:intein-encoded DNA endonuclease-like protein
MTNNKQQTAVEWFVEALTKQNMFMNLFSKEIEQAKEMEKERIIKAFDDGDYNFFYSRKTGNDFENGEEYYNEVYGGDDQ